MMRRGRDSRSGGAGTDSGASNETPSEPSQNSLTETRLRMERIRLNEQEQLETGRQEEVKDEQDDARSRRSSRNSVNSLSVNMRMSSSDDGHQVDEVFVIYVPLREEPPSSGSGRNLYGRDSRTTHPFFDGRFRELANGRIVMNSSVRQNQDRQPRRGRRRRHRANPDDPFREE